MRQTWRWFGPDDPVKLSHIRQAGAVGVVSALHHLNDGRAWPEDEVFKRKAEIEAGGLTFDVVESIVVHEDIKTRTGRYRELIENYQASIRAVAADPHHAAMRGNDVEHLAKVLVEQGTQALGAMRPLRRKPLGQAGRPGDVDQQHGRVEFIAP